MHTTILYQPIVTIPEKSRKIGKKQQRPLLSVHSYWFFSRRLSFVCSIVNGSVTSLTFLLGLKIFFRARLYAACAYLALLFILSRVVSSILETIYKMDFVFVTYLLVGFSRSHSR